ncbi:MAG: hypothetical protein HQ596_01065 [Candidatus Saganbacteria bacterium]|nr:hypothetical protein [Candidatus Saganbacteria bacterium]
MVSVPAAGKTFPRYVKVGAPVIFGPLAYRKMSLGPQAKPLNRDTVLWALARHLSPLLAKSVGVAVNRLGGLLGKEEVGRLFEMISERLATIKDGGAAPYRYIVDSPLHNRCLLRMSPESFVDSLRSGSFSPARVERGNYMSFGNELTDIHSTHLRSGGYIFVLPTVYFNEMANRGKAGHLFGPGCCFYNYCFIQGEIPISRKTTPIIFISSETNRELLKQAADGDNPLKANLAALLAQGVKLVVLDPRTRDLHQVIERTLGEEQLCEAGERLAPDTDTVVYNVLRHPDMQDITQKLVGQL